MQDRREQRTDQDSKQGVGQGSQSIGKPRLLAQAGYPGGRDPATGRRLVLTLDIGSADNPEEHQGAELIASFFDKIGVQLHLSFNNWPTFLKKIQNRQCQLFKLIWLGDYPDAQNFLQLFHTKNCSPGANHGNYVNPEFDRLYDAAMAAKTPAARDELWKKSQEIIREDCPWIFLSFPKVHALAWNRLKNYIPTDFPYGTEKYLFGFEDGNCVETVAMEYEHGLSLCISTQAGCRMGCAFCATGAAGLARSLTESEIFDQVTHVRDDFGMRVTSVVLMGQGEPFNNYDASLAAMRRFNASDGLGVGARHITVSTCGIIPGIRRFSNEPEQFTLAISLHSAVQRTRNILMPGVRKFSLLHLYEVMGEYVDKTGRRPTYEYALIRGVNDTEEELASLCDFCRDNLAHVNIKIGRASCRERV